MDSNPELVSFALYLSASISKLKGSVQRDEWGVGHMLVQFLMVWDSRDRELLKFYICVFPFPPAPEKLVGEKKII